MSQYAILHMQTIRDQGFKACLQYDHIQFIAFTYKYQNGNMRICWQEAQSHDLIIWNNTSLRQPAGWTKKTDQIPPSTHSWWMGNPHTLSHYDSEETPLLSEYTDQCCTLQPAALIKRKFSSRVVVQKLISSSASVHPQWTYIDKNLAGPCWTEFRSIYGQLKAPFTL